MELMIYGEEFLLPGKTLGVWLRSSPMEREWPAQGANGASNCALSPARAALRRVPAIYLFRSVDLEDPFFGIVLTFQFWLLLISSPGRGRPHTLTKRIARATEMLRKLIGAATLVCVGSFTCAAAYAGATLDQIKSSKEITLGYREASVPFSYLDGNQKPVGFSLDLCARVVDTLKESLGLPQLSVKYLPVAGANRIPLIKNGTIAIECGGTASNPERLQQVGFSVATFVANSRWLVKKGSGIKSAKDLKGKTVVVTQGSDSVQLAHELSDKEGLNLNVVNAHDHAESMLMLQSGRATAFLEGDILLAAKKAEATNPAQYAFLPDSYNTAVYGLMVPKNDPEFKAIVDKTLMKLMASGQFAEIYKKWFESPIPPNGTNLNFPISPALKERIAHPSDKLPV
ncbi:transporter substrate-binding domain-containing protein [Paraburkholderia phenoliruptrix]|uniref:transporter substrate-binding domain-containing protein n=1 Tax=Paraburkholderia phenoliruptrix TaxID=252970 RepID=UPI002869A0DC|nr:transporter substrate-binding domain-containing protein [Paraburkholderia phenoliruptrix]WMY10980.1 transporter substrate-binding domain-containing protein [Paraburkholderia phenoliruptrix]